HRVTKVTVLDTVAAPEVLGTDHTPKALMDALNHRRDELDAARLIHIVTASDIGRGMRRIRDGRVRSTGFYGYHGMAPGQGLIKTIAAAYAARDAGDLDSLLSDAVFQVAALGTIVYG